MPDAAWEAVKSFDAPACVIVKHANPCGVAIASNTLAPTNSPMLPTPPAHSAASSPSTAKWTAKPSNKLLTTNLWKSHGAEVYRRSLEIAAAKKKRARIGSALEAGANRFELKRVGGGLLVQTPDIHRLSRADLKVVSKRQPTEQEWNDLMFVWNVAKIRQIQRPSSSAKAVKPTASAQAK